MEKFEELRARAVQKIKVADHMLTVTFPMIKDPRMLPVILQDIFLGMSYAMQSVLSYECLYKRIPAYPETFPGRIEMFRSQCIERFKISRETLDVMREIRHILLKHQKSPTEFVRNDSFVICSDDFTATNITEAGVKNYLSKAKEFVRTASFIVSMEK